jgi:hypothetical protein
MWKLKRGTLNVTHHNRITTSEKKVLLSVVGCNMLHKVENEDFDNIKLRR